jgi:hypothetical protein
MIGTFDGVTPCVDTRCGSECLDILREMRGGKWIVECAVCGTGFETRAVPGHLAPHATEFTFWDGRFAGLTLDQTALETRGLDYIKDTAREHKRPAVREACKTWLAAREAIV